MRLVLPIACASVAAGIVLAAFPAPAAATPNGLFLAVSAHGNSWLRAVVIQCPGRAYQHPYGEATCAVVAAAGGDFDRLPGDPHPCTKEYDPVTATMSGIWRNRPITWQKTFSNACVLDAATGPVFRF